MRWTHSIWTDRLFQGNFIIDFKCFFLFFVALAKLGIASLRNMVTYWRRHAKNYFPTSHHFATISCVTKPVSFNPKSWKSMEYPSTNCTKVKGTSSSCFHMPTILDSITDSTLPNQQISLWSDGLNLEKGQILAPAVELQSKSPWILL